MRNLHYKRLLELVMANMVVDLKTSISKSVIYKQLTTKLTSERFRNIITKNTPVFYVVDTDDFAQIIIDELQVKQSSNEITISGVQRNTNTGGKTQRYISSMEISGNSQAQFPGSEDFDNSFTKLISAPGFKLGLSRAFKQALTENIKKDQFLKNYENLKPLYAQYVEELNRLATGKNPYYRFESVAKKYSSLIASQLKAKGTYIATDAKSILNNPTNGTILVISQSFDMAKYVVNAALQKAAQEYFTSKKVTLRAAKARKKGESAEGFSIGDFVDAGHTAVSDSSRKVIGVNMPSAQEMMVLLPTEQAFALEQDLSQVYADIHSDVSFNQNYTGLGGELLDMQFSFVVGMPKSLNSGALGAAEKSKLKAYRDKLLIPTIQELLKSKVVRQILESDQINPIVVAASPTLAEWATGLLAAMATGKTVPRIIKKNKTNKTTRLKTTSNNTRPLNSAPVKTQSGGSINLKTSSASLAPSGQSVSLADLQLLINIHLQDVVSANMGAGGSKGLLNYRTGRFAESVKLERLTISREGMISAFYSYMKNPYQTFEPGFAQGIPGTRSPKTLISRSIREIAATKVHNRMRTVLL